MMTRHGWMILYHGVHATDAVSGTGKHLCYSAGVMILSKQHPQTILYRSTDPVMTPSTSEEIKGVVENVVFPTGIDCRSDIGQSDRFDVYYGMADSRIGVASLTVPQQLPTKISPTVDAPNAIVPVVSQPSEAVQ